MAQTAPPYHIERFTTDNGLPSNGIKGLQWDEQTGFLWIATEAGITRYNGADFITFNRSNTPGFLSERMLFLLKTLDGRIYTADEVGDLFFVMQNKLQPVGQVKVDTRATTFKLIGLVASGKMFRQSSMQPSGDLGFDFLGQQLIPINEERILLDHWDTLFDYRAGDPKPKMLTRLPQRSRVFYTGKQLCVFSEDGFFRLNPDNLQKTELSLTGDLSGRVPEKSQLFWDNSMSSPLLIDGSNAWVLEARSDRIVAHLICTVVPTDALLLFAKYDALSGMLFLGTASEGIVIIRPNQIRMVKARPSLRQTIASYSQVALPGGDILTNQGEVLGEKLPYRGRLPIPSDFNNFVLQTQDSILWYSRDDTIYSYDYHTYKKESFLAGRGSITDGLLAAGGKLYVANAVGVGVIDKGRVDYQYRYPKADINSNAPFSMIEISPGFIGIACCNGLFRFNMMDHRLDTLLCWPGICIRALWKYKDYLFVGTYGKGIWLYRDGQFKHIPGDKNGYLQYAHCFMPDSLGFCWISTNRGLFRARPEDMVDAYERETPVYYHYYGRANGLEMTELNGGCTPCALQLNDSTLSFPSMDGLAWVNPSEPLPRLPEGSIYIDEFTADGKKINPTSLVQPDLPSNTRELVFSLGFPAWAGQENLYVEYKLDAYAKDWEILDIKNPRLRYSNLPSGNYRLEIRKSNGFGKVRYSNTAISFHIDKRWYQEGWVWLLMACLLSALVMAIVRLRTRQFQLRQNKLEKQIAEKTRELQAKNEELERTDLIKTRLISIISHDLITPLRFLHYTGKSLTEKHDELTEAVKQEAIAEITTTAKELELLSTNILNWIKYRNEDRRLAKESFNLHELVSQLFSIFNAMAKQKQIQLINAVEERQSLYQFIEPVKIVLYNCILNSINFTPRGYIRVSCIREREALLMQIEDTGVGMTQEQINNIMADHFIISSANVDRRKGNGLGYLIIKDLLKILKGTLAIQSEKEKGTKVMIRVPLT